MKKNNDIKIKHAFSLKATDFFDTQSLQITRELVAMDEFDVQKVRTIIQEGLKRAMIDHYSGMKTRHNEKMSRCKKELLEIAKMPVIGAKQKKRIGVLEKRINLYKHKVANANLLGRAVRISYEYEALKDLTKKTNGHMFLEDFFNSLKPNTDEN